VYQNQFLDEAEVGAGRKLSDGAARAKWRKRSGVGAAEVLEPLQAKLQENHGAAVLTRGVKDACKNLTVELLLLRPRRGDASHTA